MVDPEWLRDATSGAHSAHVCGNCYIVDMLCLRDRLGLGVRKMRMRVSTNEVIKYSADAPLQLAAAAVGAGSTMPKAIMDRPDHASGSASAARRGEPVGA